MRCGSGLRQRFVVKALAFGISKNITQKGEKKQRFGWQKNEC